jgi:hypothetical protein
MLSTEQSWLRSNGERSIPADPAGRQSRLNSGREVEARLSMTVAIENFRRNQMSHWSALPILAISTPIVRLLDPQSERQHEHMISSARAE